MSKNLLTYVVTGIPELDQALSDIGDRVVMRQVVRGPAVAALAPTSSAIKMNSRRTHPLSMQRSPITQALVRAGRTPNRRIGPMARYLRTKSISARAQSIGARISYDTQIFPGFVVYGKSTGKRAFYPAAQEYGAAANPRIKPKRQMGRAVESTQSQVLSIFRQKFRTSYETRTARLMKRRGVNVTIS
jgi:hypothetical protein